MNKTTRKLVFSGLFAALCCVMTMVIQIPSPTGYVNLGDCMILLGALALGPVYGALAGGIGSALADILQNPYRVSRVVKGLNRIGETIFHEEVYVYKVVIRGNHQGFCFIGSIRF